MVVVCHLWTWHLSAFDSVNWLFRWLASRSTFMSHVTPLSLSKECIVHCCIVCPSSLVMLPSLLSFRPMFKGRKKFNLAIKTTFVSVPLSQSYGYIIYNIPELCFEFHVIYVGFIMALLRRDYSHWHQLIIWKIVLETILVPWDLYASMTDSLTLDIGSHHWHLIDRFDWVFDIKSSLHTQGIVLGYLGNHWHQWCSPSHLLTIHIIDR